MKRVLFIAVIVFSGIFTSCTDSSEENVEASQNELQLTGGEDDLDPDEDPDADSDGN